MPINEELSALEAVVDEFERDIETGKISVEAIVNHITRSRPILSGAAPVGMFIKSSFRRYRK